MAGHPTVGAAFTILKRELLKPKHSNDLTFDLGTGPTKVEFEQGPLIWMNQPCPKFGEVFENGAIIEALSLD